MTDSLLVFLLPNLLLLLAARPSFNYRLRGGARREPQARSQADSKLKNSEGRDSKKYNGDGKKPL